MEGKNVWGYVSVFYIDIVWYGEVFVNFVIVVVINVFVVLVVFIVFLVLFFVFVVFFNREKVRFVDFEKIFC